MTTPLKGETWYDPIIDLMLEEGLDFLSAALALGIPGITLEDAVGHMRRRAWKEAFETKSKEWEEHQASPAVHSKNALVGRMRRDAMRLRANGKAAEAAEIEFKISKIEGWGNGDGNVNIFNQLSGDNMDELRRRLEAKKLAQ